MMLDILYNMRIIIDNREDKGRISHIKQFFDCECEVTQLDTGDIIIQQDNIPDIAIEVKTHQDFIQSFKKRSVQDEIIRMKQKYPFSYLVIYDDGKLNKKYTRTSRAQWHSNIHSLAIRYHVHVFFADNLRDFLECLQSIANTVSKHDKPISPPNVRNKNNNPYVNVLIGVPKIGNTTAEKLLETFGKPSDVLTATQDDLDNVSFRLTQQQKEWLLKM